MNIEQRDYVGQCRTELRVCYFYLLSHSRDSESNLLCQVKLNSDVILPDWHPRLFFFLFYLSIIR